MVGLEGMACSPSGVGLTMAFDVVLKKNLDHVSRAVRDDWDGILYLGGTEGAGKTVLAMQIAKYLDTMFCLDRVVFSPQQFLDAIEAAKPCQAIVYDEAQDAFESTRRDKTSSVLKSVMTRMRSMNLFVIIVSPHFWGINKYLFCHRSRAFIRVYARRVGNDLVRGFYAFYGGEAKHKLYVRGKRWEDISVAKPDFTGRFDNERVLDWRGYQEKKDAGTKEAARDEAVTDKGRVWKKQRDAVIKELYKYLKQADIARVVGLGQPQVNQIINNNEEE